MFYGSIYHVLYLQILRFYLVRQSLRTVHYRSFTLSPSLLCTQTYTFPISTIRPALLISVFYVQRENLFWQHLIHKNCIILHCLNLSAIPFSLITSIYLSSFKVYFTTSRVDLFSTLDCCNLVTGQIDCRYMYKIAIHELTSTCTYIHCYSPRDGYTLSCLRKTETQHVVHSAEKPKL